MSNPIFIRAYLSAIISLCASQYSDEEDRILDQVVRPRSASMAEVMTRPMGPVPSIRFQKVG
jgi:hypothetical protein